METIRLGMVGYGVRGPGLWTVAGQVPGLVPAAICDRSEAVRNTITVQCPDAVVYDDLTAMLDDGVVDAVLIETPPATHAACAVAALERGIHVLSDVPAVHTLAEADTLWQAQQRSDAIYMFGATSNYWGFVRTCSELIERGLLGKPFYLEAEYVHDLREFSRATPWRIGYEPIRYCTHSLGPLLSWMGQELIEAVCFDTGGHMDASGQGHDAMAAMFRTADDRVVHLLVSFTNSNDHGQHRFVCHGTAGRFDCTWPLTGEAPVVRFASRQVYGLDKPVDLHVAADRPDLPTLATVSGHGPIDYAMLSDFVDAIAARRPCAFDLRDALAMTLPGLYALESAKRGGEKVTIDYPWNA